AAIYCAQPGAKLRVDAFRLYEGEHDPNRPVGPDVAAAPPVPSGRNAPPPATFANPSFEEGTSGWRYKCNEQHNLRRTYRRSSCVLTRLLANLGVAAETPVIERFHTPAAPDGSDKRWLQGMYLDEPIDWDDPYRFFRW
ncbi:MAG: hypothetical protein QHJ73_17555, partial [Armatimonadota bacterium]|nr:hypothetical protein [Armatimonadota bacterium]